MNIEDLTAESVQDSAKFLRHRKIAADDHGELRLVAMELGSEEQGNLMTSSALVFLPADGGAPVWCAPGRSAPG
ncbi:hypothetical protein [Roseivivax sp. CAU 1761]